MQKWYKTTELWAYGYGDIDYVCLNTSIGENNIKDFYENLKESARDKNGWSDKWRRLIIEPVYKPPQEWVEKKIKDTEEKIKHLMGYVNGLREI